MTTFCTTLNLCIDSVILSTTEFTGRKNLIFPTLKVYSNLYKNSKVVSNAVITPRHIKIISPTGCECDFRKVITGQLVVIREEGATMEWCNNELTQFILGWCGRGTAAVWRPADYIQHRDAPPLRTLRHRTVTEHCGHAHAQPDLHE